MNTIYVRTLSAIQAGMLMLSIVSFSIPTAALADPVNDSNFHPPVVTAPSCTIVSDTADQVDGHGAVPVSPIHPYWTASIPDATWVWSENPLEPASATDGVSKTFTKTYTITGQAADADLQIAADNTYNVMIDGLPLASDPSGDNFSSADSIHIIHTPFLTPGTHTISFTVDNAPVAGSDGLSNPAGLLYKLTL
ncbi:MAG: hypothetical protein JWL82_593, partial [Parcubacteria group bacterium]|nr:hypothetical protein [Parcubacteria group bacterium]